MPGGYPEAERPTRSGDPIALVGIGCRFPGADGPAAFWQLLCAGGVAIGDIPPSRFDASRYYDPRPATPGKIMSRKGGFIEKAEFFDADFFGLSPREVERMDPQQRWLLETTWEALEDAGQVPARLAGTQTGVFVGMWVNEYESRLFRDPRAVDFYMTTGSGRYAASGRLSYQLGLQGPSFTVDSGCSASLLAVHLACQSLWSGESTMALAAGANAILEPSVAIAYSQSQMVAPDGLCKFGDARADGYVRSEGAAVVVLKRLSQAIADGDRVYATILGSAVNNDGRSSGFLTTPGTAGQEEVLRLAYRNAGVSPGRVSYVEAHGTGTRAGDPVEINALGAVLADGRAPGARCRIGSVKTNIGHAEGAAGLAGLVKVALSLHYRTLPPSLHLQEPNPEIDWSALPLDVQQRLEPWPAESGSLVAGVSSFGIAGTNAHVVLQSAPETNGAARREEVGGRPYVLPLSAHTPEALDARVRQFRARMGDRSDEKGSLGDICWTAGVRRDHHEHRIALTGRTFEDMAAHLEAALAGEAQAGVAVGRRSRQRRDALVFVFPGQGSQWVGMGRRLFECEPAFRAAIERCDRAIHAETGWSVIAMLRDSGMEERLRSIDVIQPVLFSVEVALAALWRSWGFEPRAVVGHSMGEVAAAHVAGALSLEDAVQVICRRSRLLLRTSGKGAMALVELPMADAHEALRGQEHRLSVAVSNSARSTVISGDPDALDSLLASLEAREVFCRRVKVDVASHSPQMDPLRADLVAALGGLCPRAGTIPIYSTVRGAVIDGSQCDATYWSENLREPVLFAGAIAALLESGHDTFIEMSPHPILVPAVQETIDHSGAAGAVATGSTRRDEDEQLALMGAVGALYAAGVNVLFDRVSEQTGRLVDLPAYPWQRERHWFEAPSQLDLVSGRGITGTSSDHPWLPPRIAVAGRTDSSLWQFELDVQALRLAHGEGDLPPFVSPAIYLELLIASARALGLTGEIHVTDIVLGRPQPSPSDGTSAAMQIVTARDDDGRYVWRLFSGDGGSWDEHASAVLHLETPPLAASGHITGEAVPIALPDGVQQDPGCYSVHPSILDAALRVASSAEPTLGYPAVIGRLTLWGDIEPSPAIESLARGDRGVLLRREGRDLLALDAVEVMGGQRAPGRVSDWLYELAWTRSAPPAAGRAVAGTYLLVTDDTAMARTLAERLRASGAQAGIVPHGTERNTVQAQLDAASALTIVHIVSPLADRDTAAAASSAIRSALGSLTAALSCHASAAPPRLWFVTSDAQAVVPGESLDRSHAPVWGLARTLAEEHPELWGGVIDRSSAMDDAVTADCLMEALSAGDGEDQVAYRGTDRFVLRLCRVERSLQPLRVRPDASYLITGGLGDLGLAVAGALVDRGARHLVLVGRRGLPPRFEWHALSGQDAARASAVQRLEAADASVEVVAADVGDRAQIDRLFRERLATGRRLAGVVHCAGVSEWQLLTAIDDETFADVWRAKVAGTCHLIDATESLSLDMFLMFSSTAAFLPSPGQASYAAGNAFLDATAADCQARGRRALSISWGPWAGIGMAADLERRGASNVRARGMESLARDQALAALVRIGGEQGRQVAVLPFDARRWRSGGPPMALLADLVPADARTDEAADAGAGLGAQLAAAVGADERRTILEELLKVTIAHVLKRPVSRIDLTTPLRTLGLDSLMALELRNRLEAVTGVRLPATLAWNYPTVSVMAPFLASKLHVALVNEEAEAPAAAAGTDLEALLAEIEQISDDEARRLAFDGQ
jgi:myxalamid-type polyketide synthase MxaE and MxaD